MPPRSPVPDDVRAELERVARRWQELPLDRALGHVAAVRDLVEDLAHALVPGAVVPDLGPAVVVDQLRVLAYDACTAGGAEGLADRLAALRRSLT